jgi:hypothetical protein
MKKVYYVGDWAILTGPVFAETPFHHSPKGLEIFNYGIWLKEALEKDPTFQVNSVSAWDFYNNLGPGDYEQILKDLPDPNKYLLKTKPDDTTNNSN